MLLSIEKYYLGGLLIVLNNEQLRAEAKTHSDTWSIGVYCEHSFVVVIQNDGFKARSMVHLIQEVKIVLYSTSATCICIMYIYFCSNKPELQWILFDIQDIYIQKSLLDLIFEFTLHI